MPPRKRARISEATSPATQESSIENKLTDEDILNDPWTDEEEIGLFKGLIKWKPTGMHKHFRMLQLREYLLDNNYIHPRTKHTQIQGIWHKLESLYDLEALDQREDARQLSDLSEKDGSSEDEEQEDDVYSLAANKVHNSAFELPEDEYREKMWSQRLATGGDESPLQLPELNLTNELPVKFTPSFSIEPEDVATPSTRPRGRPPKAAAKTRPAPISRRSRRQTGSVATASDAEEAEVTNDEENASVEHEEDNEGGEEESEGSGEDVASQGSTTATRGRSGRGRGRGTARGRPRGRRR